MDTHTHLDMHIHKLQDNHPLIVSSFTSPGSELRERFKSGSKQSGFQWVVCTVWVCLSVLCVPYVSQANVHTQTPWCTMSISACTLPEDICMSVVYILSQQYLDFSIDMQGPQRQCRLPISISWPSARAPWSGIDVEDEEKGGASPRGPGTRPLLPTFSSLQIKSLSTSQQLSIKSHRWKVERLDRLRVNCVFRWQEVFTSRCVWQNKMDFCHVQESKVQDLYL